jgi:tripeptidyl-peptidase-1
LGIATGVNTTFLSVGGDDFVKALIDTTTYLNGLADPPLVMTTSYGEDETNYAHKDAKKICDGYMALGARGVSVIFASGDGGVRGNHDDSSQCSNNTFNPVFPASCPYGK